MNHIILPKARGVGKINFNFDFLLHLHIEHQKVKYLNANILENTSGQESETAGFEG
jgi:hypothetical protein